MCIVFDLKSVIKGTTMQAPNQRHNSDTRTFKNPIKLNLKSNR